MLSVEKTARRYSYSVSASFDDTEQPEDERAKSSFRKSKEQQQATSVHKDNRQSIVCRRALSLQDYQQSIDRRNKE
jgi:hypothetical protein